MSTLTKSELLGFTLLGCVVLIWVMSGFFIQNLFVGDHYDHPVAMTVFSVGLCSFLLLIPKRFRESPTDRKVAPLLTGSAGKSSGRVAATLGLGVIWLFAQMLYNVSLKYMSVSSSTAVSSTSSVFTFLFSLLLLRNYTLTVPAVAAIGMSVAGVLTVAHTQPSTGGFRNSPLLGTTLALTSCCCYGMFTTLLKRYETRHGSSTHILTLFGYFGIVAVSLGSILIVIADRTGIDPFQWPSSPYAVIGIFLNALLGSVLSDVLLAKSVLLLNPITTSIGLTLTMPVSLLIDSVVFGRHSFHPAFLVGMLLQFGSICLISYDNHKQRRINP